MTTVVREDFRSLAYKLGQERELPLLITDLIADYLDERDLLRISMLSKDFNIHANASIYRDIIVDLDRTERTSKKASLLIRTLLTSTSAASAVCTLSLVGHPLACWRNKLSPVGYDESVERPLRGKIPPEIYADLTSFTQREIDKVAAILPARMQQLNSKVPVWALYLHVLPLTSRIQDLSISSDYFRSTDFRDTLQVIADMGLFQKLQSCNLCLDLLRGRRRHPSVVQDWDSTLLIPFLAPDIKSLAAVVSLKSKAIRQPLRSGSSLTRLILHHYQIHNSDLSALLAATPMLQYLKYHATTDYAWLISLRRKEAASGHGVGIEPLYNALHHVADSLRELHICHDFDEDSFHFDESYAMGNEPSFHQRKELSCLKQLHTLTIPYTTLLWRREEWGRKWTELLPSSLRNITLTDDLIESFFDLWTDESLMPVISELVEWLSATQRGGKGAEFGLNLFKLTFDFNEPVRRALSRMCEERGVQCSIVKALPDRNGPTPKVRRTRGGGNLTRGRGRGRGTEFYQLHGPTGNIRR